MHKLLVAVSIFGATPLAMAEVLVDPMATRTAVGPSIASSEVEYEDDDGDKFSVEREVAGVNLNIGLGRSAALMLQAYHTFDAEVEDSSWLDDGEGNAIGIGFTIIPIRTPRTELSVYGLFNRASEEYDVPGKKSVELVVSDVHLGTEVLFAATPAVGITAGVDVVAFSKGTVEYRSSETDIERDDRLSLKIGAQFSFSSVTIAPVFAFSGEESIAVIATFGV